MRHRVSGRKLGKKTAHRIAMFRNMAASLIEKGRIQTTLPKAKELRRIAEKLVTLGKTNTLHTRRQAFNFMRNKKIVKKLFDEVAPAFEKRAGGYTRIYKLGARVGDAAKMAIIEFLQEDLLSAKVEGKIPDVKADKKKAKAKKAAPKKEVKEKKETQKDAKAKKVAATTEKKEKKLAKKATKSEKAPAKKTKKDKK